MSARDSRLGRAVRLFGAGGLAVCAMGAAACQSSSVLDLKVGDCVMLPEGDEAVTMERLPCSDSHEAEVSALVPTDPAGAEAAFPGAEALAAQAEAACVDSFESYAGAPYVTSSLDVTWLLPTEGSWGEGDRQIVCLITAMDAQPLGSSVRDSKL